jgi:hypothetical protein
MDWELAFLETDHQLVSSKVKQKVKWTKLVYQKVILLAGQIQMDDLRAEKWG